MTCGIAVEVRLTSFAMRVDKKALAAIAAGGAAEEREVHVGDDFVLGLHSVEFTRQRVQSMRRA